MRAAAFSAGPCLLAEVWYFKDTSTGVGYGSYKKGCDSRKLFCSGGKKFGLDPRSTGRMEHRWSGLIAPLKSPLHEIH